MSNNKQPRDWSFILQMVMLALVVLFGFLAVFSSAPFDPVRVEPATDALDNQTWLQRYDEQRALRKQQQDNDLLRHFAPAVPQNNSPDSSSDISPSPSNH